MANQQHIEWLMEGVAAWNARRGREEFLPDFEGADFRDFFQQNVFCLNAADFHDANLREAKQTSAVVRMLFSGGF